MAKFHVRCKLVRKGKNSLTVSICTLHWTRTSTRNSECRMEGFLDTNGQTVNANNVSPHEDFKNDELEKLSSKSLLPLVPIPPTSKADMLEIGELLEYVFGQLDFDTLKNTRFVSKKWNSEACRILQKRSYVSLVEPRKNESQHQNQLEEFAKILHESSLNGLPNAFKLYYAHIEKLHERMNSIVSLPEVHIVKMFLNKCPVCNNVAFQDRIYAILKKNSHCLKYLRCSLKGHQELHEESKTCWKNLHLPALENFGFWEVDRRPKTSCIEFLCSVINNAPILTHLVPGSDDENILASILNQTDLTKIEDLYIECATRRHFELLASVQLPRLTTLGLHVSYLHLSENKVPSETLQAIVTNFSASLEELSVSWVSNTPDTDFPNCPKLRKLSISDWTGTLEVFNPVKLPRLQHVHLQSYVEGLEDSDVIPHPGVTVFAFECGLTEANEPNGQEIDEEYGCFFEFIMNQFPCITKLVLTMAISNELLAGIVKTFPHLLTLILDSKFAVSEHLFTGINRLSLSRMIRKGISLNGAVRLISLSDLKSLRTLVLGRYNHTGLILSNNAVQYGIAKMPKLRVLQFNWHAELSVDVVATSLSHLKKIVINNSYSYESYSTLELLSGRMPQVDLDSSGADQNTDI